ncbi:sigma-70 family RNA polymerase sigma factor [Streptomyces sp. NPDC059985]|uniref:sigma-70 family RNA polymerase sigma factor n=1 Tax=Streptomyces sp. NPDC059985 TaxID=3347025 RepID=UPI0036C1FED9
MTISFDPKRPGRKLGPIATNVGSSHRAWLEPVRGSYLASGMTLDELSLKVPLAKSKLSELLRGLGLYPRWEVLNRLSSELEMPEWPLYRLWRQAALDVQKTPGWIERSTGEPLVITDDIPPLDHGAFCQTVQDGYRRYAQVFLFGELIDIAVEDTFNILWLIWPEALASADSRRFAWNTLRSTVMARTPHLDGRPDLGLAAFDTVALQNLTNTTERTAQLAESLQLFRVISGLPDAHQDVMVLRYLCGSSPEEASSLLGLPLPTVLSDELHALRHVENTLCPPPDTEGLIE